MPKPVWACPTCGEDFTRKSSAMRHSSKLHNGRVFPIRYIDYLTGRQSGQYPPPLTPMRLLGRKNRTVADSSRGNISHANDFETNSRSEHKAVPLTVTNPSRNPVVEAVREYMDVKKTYTQLQPLINVNTFPTDTSIAKPIGFRGYICDLCQSGPIEAVWKFVEDGSLKKANHMCDAEAVLRAKHLAEDQKKALHHASFRCLADIVNYWIGDAEVYLKAEELFPTESYDFVTDAERPSPGGYISLGDLRENHWADRVVKENKKTSMATGAVSINNDELMDFLSITRATFGIFRVKMPKGGTRDFFMYIVRGLEFCKFSHLNGLAAKSNNVNNCDNTSQQTDLYNVIQFVEGGLIFRWDKLDSMGTKNLLGQIQERSKNLGGYSYW
jgi:hypothetical protein